MNQGELWGLVNWKDDSDIPEMKKTKIKKVLVVDLLITQFLCMQSLSFLLYLQIKMVSRKLVGSSTSGGSKSIADISWLICTRIICQARGLDGTP